MKAKLQFAAVTIAALALLLASRWNPTERELRNQHSGIQDRPAIENLDAKR